MKRNNILYWTFTGLAAAQALMAGIMYFTRPEIAAGFEHLGFPDYLRPLLGGAKICAAIVLLLPILSFHLKEWAYAGLGITYISATVAHAVVDGMDTTFAPLATLAILMLSYLFALRKFEAMPSSRTARPTFDTK